MILQLALGHFAGRRVSLDPRGACGIPFFLEPFLPDPPGFGVSGDPQWFWGLRGSPVGHGADWIPVVKTDQKHTCSEILLGITWSRVREDLKVDDEEGGDSARRGEARDPVHGSTCLMDERMHRHHVNIFSSGTCTCAQIITSMSAENCATAVRATVRVRNIQANGRDAARICSWPTCSRPIGS